MGKGGANRRVFCPNPFSRRASEIVGKREELEAAVALEDRAK